MQSSFQDPAGESGNMVGEAGRRLEAVEKLAAAAELVEAQEHQAWCELPLREVAYALTRSQEAEEPGMDAANALVRVCIKTGQSQRAAELGTALLQRIEGKFGPKHIRLAATLNDLGNACGQLGLSGKRRNCRSAASQSRSSVTETSIPK